MSVAKKWHRALVAKTDLMIPEMTPETWDWLRANVHSPFELVSVGDGDTLEEDYIQFENYTEFLHFRLRWEA